MNRFISSCLCLSLATFGGALGAACGETSSSGKSDLAPNSKPASDARTPVDTSKDSSEPAAPPGGRIAVFVESGGPVQLTLTGPSGQVVRARAPFTLCGAEPGDWRVRADSTGHAPGGTSVSVPVYDETFRVDLTLVPTGGLRISGKGPLNLVGPDGKSEKVTLPYAQTGLTPGVYRLVGSSGRWTPAPELRVMVPAARQADIAWPDAETRKVSGMGGLMLAGKPHALPKGTRLVTFLQRPGWSLYRRRGGRKTFQKRTFDLGPVENLAQLQWKARSVIIHAHRAKDTKAALSGWVKTGQARHVVVEPDGTLSQLLDLVEEARAVGHLIDETTIHVSVDITSGKVGPAQHKALAALLGTLSSLFPRIQPKFPTEPDGGRVLARLADPRAYKGWMGAHHVVADRRPVSSTPGHTAGEPGALLDEVGLKSASTALFALPIKEVEHDAMARRWRTLTVTIDPASNATIRLNAPGGDVTKGQGVAVVCQPERGRWWLDAAAPDHASERRRPLVADENVVTRIELSRVGDVVLTGRSGQAAVLTGPGSLKLNVTLPYEGKGLKAGSYRLSIDRSAQQLEPYRLGFRIDAGQRSELAVPDVTDVSLPAILIGGQPYPLPANLKVVNYKAKAALSFYAAQRRARGRRLFMKRMLPTGQNTSTLSEASSVTRMVVLHADVIRDTATTFKVLSSRGLSSHFGIEWDGTIYQMLDPQDAAFAAAEVNPYSIQVDLNNLLPNLVVNPRANPYPRFHRRKRQMRQPEYKRPKSQRVLINGRDVQSYGYTDAQYRSLLALVRVLTGVFERVDPKVPLDGAGKVPLDFFDGAEDFGGIIAHWHLTPRRWDPGPGFDWQRLREGLAGRR